MLAMDPFERAAQAALEFDPSTTKLITRRDLKHGDVVFPKESLLPSEKFELADLQLLIRTRCVDVVPVDSVRVSATPVATVAAVPVASQAQGVFPCDHPGCGKGPFKTKVALGSHKKAHR